MHLQKQGVHTEHLQRQDHRLDVLNVQMFWNPKKNTEEAENQGIQKLMVTVCLIVESCGQSVAVALP